MTKRREEARARMAATAGQYMQALDQADALIAAGHTEAPHWQAEMEDHHPPGSCAACAPATQEPWPAGHAEPDRDVTPSLGAALANPDDPLMLSADEWALVLRVAHLTGLGPAQQPREETR